MDYIINDDYLDDDDDGLTYSTKNYRSDSDDDDFSTFMSHISKKKKIKVFESSQKKDSNKQDDFEREMAAELAATMKRLTAPSSSQSGSEDNAESEKTHYDKIYFDSDEENETPTSDERHNKHRVLTNDELLYDPLMDEVDQAWVDNNRRKYQINNRRMKNGGEKFNPQALPQSDAVLNCPACFTTLCLDCQRHEIYKNQYRAMFVFNCVVDKSERLHFAIKEDKKSKFKKGKKNKLRSEISNQNTLKVETADEFLASADNSCSSKNGDEMGDTFNPVKCTECNTKVAVQDQSEVYHFFNVLTSY